MQTKKVHLFLLFTTLFWWLGFYWWQMMGDKSILFLLNHNYNNILDVFYAFLSFWGRGDTIAILLLVLLAKSSFRHKVYLKFILLYGFTTGFITWGLKTYFNINRPLMQYPGEIHKVAWLSQAFEYSFPSGHTLGIFSFCSFVLTAFGINNHRWHIIALLLSVGCGISRIYLGQHFMSDVLFGAALGSIIGTTIGIFAQKQFHKSNITLF